MENKIFDIISNDETIHYDTLFDLKYEIGIRLQDKNIAFPNHYHNYVEIVCQLNAKSIQYVDEQYFELKENEFLIINPKQAHRNEATNSDVINLIISEKFLTSLLMESAFSDDIVKLKNSLLSSKHVKAYKVNSKMNYLLKALYDNFINQSTLYYLKQKTIITDFLISLYETDQLIDEEHHNQTDNLTDYIKNNLKTASLNEYARQNNYSASLVSQKIKSSYNMTFIEILHEVRLREAIRLLMTNKKIDDIIFDVGYQNKTHFYKLFKRKYHITPKEYKNMYVNKLKN